MLIKKHLQSNFTNQQNQTMNNRMNNRIFVVIVPSIYMIRDYLDTKIAMTINIGRVNKSLSILFYEGMDFCSLKVAQKRYQICTGNINKP